MKYEVKLERGQVVKKIVALLAMIVLISGGAFAGEIVLEGHPVIVVNEDGTANETGFRVFTNGD